MKESLTRNRRILIIDDQQSIHDAFSTILDNTNASEQDLDAFESSLFGESLNSDADDIEFGLDHAIQGEQGFEKVQSAVLSDSPYAVAFVDMRMPPGWDGLQTIEQLWKVDPELQIVICTAYSDYKWEEVIQRLGRNDKLLLLKKPFTNQEVFQLAIALTEKWRLTKDLQKQVFSLTEANTRLEAEIASRQQAESRLSKMAYFDRLTDLPNRYVLNERLERALAKTARGTNDIDALMCAGAVSNDRPYRDEAFRRLYHGLFGPGIRRELNNSLKEAKERHGFVTSLPMSASPLPPKAPKAKSVPKQPTKVKKDESLEVIIGLIDQFCKEHLNEEYAELCRRLAEKLARKRPSPLTAGKPNTWACGILRTTGWVNFLDDRRKKPHMKLTAIYKVLGVGESTLQGKSMLIRKMLKISPMDPEWTLPSRISQNPMAWMIQITGFQVDARFLKREIQEEAFRKGLIPYIPERPQTQRGGHDEDE